MTASYNSLRPLDDAAAAALPPPLDDAEAAALLPKVEEAAAAVAVPTSPPN